MFLDFKLAFKIGIVATASWVAVHILAIFGPFIALAYPIVWLLAPDKTFCFFCRAKTENAYCPVCRKPINKTKGLYPKSMFSASINAICLFLVSLVFVFAIYIEGLVLNKILDTATDETVTFVIPSKQQYFVNRQFDFEIKLANIKQPINVVQTDIKFDPTSIELLEIDVEDSFATIFIQKDIDNQLGYARITGGLLNPGYQGEQGLFATLKFKGKAPSVGIIEYMPTSAILASDGKGTNTLKELGKMEYVVLPEPSRNDVSQSPILILEPKDVLGTETKVPKLEIYDEQPVLGIATESSATTKVPKQDHVRKLYEIPILALKAVIEVDKAILRLWIDVIK